MPNWCTNELTVTGPAVKDFLKACEGKTPRYKNIHTFYVEKNDFNEPDSHYGGDTQSFTFNAIVPVPKDIEEAGFSQTGYDWQVHNWGTKWDINDPIINLENEVLQISMDTAWSPPIEWVEKASAKFPDLQFSLLFEEGGAMFAGQIIFNGGEAQVVEEHTDWESYKMFVIEHMGYDEEAFDEMEEDMQ